MSKISGQTSDELRFGFGENWDRFLDVIDDERIRVAEKSLLDSLNLESLNGKRFLDIGSGSGLFSLAARRLGAKIFSFDLDLSSVSCTSKLKEKFFPDDEEWVIEQGNILDLDFVQSLGVFDIVYSWGVLHHTGDMWTALNNATSLVAPGGQFFLSIYNDQGRQSIKWKARKRTYNLLPRGLKLLFALVFIVPREVWALLRTRSVRKYVLRWTEYGQNRGMSQWHDWIDWIGGYPFEVAKPEAVFDFYKTRGFVLEKLMTRAGGWGCNQFVFRLCEKNLDIS